MNSRRLPSFRLLRQFAAMMAILIATTISPAQAQKAPSACVVQQVSELELALEGRYQTNHPVAGLPRGEGYIEMGVIGPVGDLPSIETVGALVKKASTRL